MQKLKKELKLKFSGAKKIAFVGVGSDLRGDDALGMMIAEGLKEKFKTKNSKFKVFLGGTAPENWTGQIRKFKPTHVVIIDAADIGKAPGDARVIEISQASSVSFCTHQLPLKIMADYIIEAIGCEVIIIGVQPKNIEFGSCISKEVVKSIKTIIDTIKYAAL